MSSVRKLNGSINRAALTPIAITQNIAAVTFEGIVFEYVDQGRKVALGIDVEVKLVVIVDETQNIVALAIYALRRLRRRSEFWLAAVSNIFAGARFSSRRRVASRPGCKRLTFAVSLAPSRSDPASPSMTSTKRIV